jgi:hypothetical protein
MLNYFFEAVFNKKFYFTNNTGIGAFCDILSETLPNINFLSDPFPLVPIITRSAFVE